MIYLDNAATTLIKPAAVERAVVNAMRTMASPGRGSHSAAMRAAETVLLCREEAAALFHVPEPEQVVFTMNATHALNIAVHSLIKPGMRVLVSGYEHNSVTRPLHQIGAELVTARTPLFDRNAVLTAFERELPHCGAAVCTHVSNVFGFILPIYEIALLCRQYRVPLIVDASQSAGVLDVNFEKLGAAFIAMPGHKGLFGPQGTGLLLCGERGEALMSGGSGSDSALQTMPDYLPDRLEAGTHNVCGIAGLCEGIRYVREKGTEEIFAHEQRLMEQIEARLGQIEGIELFSGKPETQSGVLSFRPRSGDCESLGEYLSDRSVCVRCGLHCAPSAHESAGTLRTGTLRLSLSPFVSPEDVAEFGRIAEEYFK